MFLAAVVKAHLPPLPERADSRVADEPAEHERDTMSDGEARAATPFHNPIPARSHWL